MCSTKIVLQPNGTRFKRLNFASNDPRYSFANCKGEDDVWDKLLDQAAARRALGEEMSNKLGREATEQEIRKEVGMHVQAPGLAHVNTHLLSVRSSMRCS